MPTSKKIFFIFLALFCLSLVFFGIYKVIYEKSTPTEIPIKNKPINAPIEKPKDPPKVSSAPISVLTDEPVLAPTIVNGTSAIKYYSKANGQVYQIDFNGNNKRTLSDRSLSGLIAVSWSPDKNKVITKFSNGENSSFYCYDYAAQKNTNIKSNIDEIVWQNSNNLIFYKYFDPLNKKRTLNFSAPDGSNWIKLADISVQNISIAQIPGSSLVSFWNKPDSFTETSLKSVPVIGGETKELFKGAFGADYLWSGNGANTLVSSVSAKGGSKMQLSAINANGGELKNLNVPTIASKCIWMTDNKNILCALPGEVPESAIMPNDYYQEKFHTTDTFWKINTLNGEKSRIIEPTKIDSKYDAVNLFLNADESILFFQNRTDGKLYRITM